MTLKQKNVFYILSSCLRRPVCAECMERVGPMLPCAGCLVATCVTVSDHTLPGFSSLSLTHSCLSLDISVSSVIPVMCPAPWTDSPEPCLVLEEDYTVTPRPHPVSHPPLDAPLCGTCRHLDLSFFDPSCPGCAEILKSRETR